MKYTFAASVNAAGTTLTPHICSRRQQAGPQAHCTGPLAGRHHICICAQRHHGYGSRVLSCCRRNRAHHDQQQAAAAAAGYWQGCCCCSCEQEARWLWWCSRRRSAHFKQGRSPCCNGNVLPPDTWHEQVKRLWLVSACSTNAVISTGSTPVPDCCGTCVLRTQMRGLVHCHSYGTSAGA
jgi:hypothetical protein